MGALLALLALLFPSPTPTPWASGAQRTMPWVHSRTVWGTCRVEASGAALVRGGTVTITRAGTDTCTCADTTPLSAAANQLCVTESGAGWTSGLITTEPQVLTAGQDWCTTWEGTPTGAWDASRFFAWATGSSNPLRALDVGTDGKAYCETTDADGKVKYIIATHGFASGTRHSITCCGTSTGTLSIRLDRVQVSGTIYSTGGSGVQASLGNTLTIGSTVTGTLRFSGRISRVAQCASATLDCW